MTWWQISITRIQPTGREGQSDPLKRAPINVTFSIVNQTMVRNARSACPRDHGADALSESYLLIFERNRRKSKVNKL
jgi:hypothetical protein